MIGKDIIRRPIIDEIDQAKFFTIICDEASSGTKVFMSLAIRYVTADNTIKEQFVSFHPVGKRTGHILSQQILDKVTQLGLDITKCRGQGYDGCSHE